MKRIFSFIAMTCVFYTGFADTQVWQGKVNSNGDPSPSVKLNLGKRYKIIVSGKINLGKWRTAGQPLENDACFEFFADSDQQGMAPQKLDTFKNSINIDVCDGKYRTNHVYESQPFRAVQSGVHFWIHDIDYEDNSGELDVQVLQVEE